MFRKSTVYVILLLPCLGFGPESEPRDLSAYTPAMLRATIVSLDRDVKQLQQDLKAANETITSLKARLDKAKKEHKATANELTKCRAKQQKRISRVSDYKDTLDGGKPAIEDTISGQQIQTMGDEYVGRRASLGQVTFIQSGNEYIDRLPNAMKWVGGGPYSGIPVPKKIRNEEECSKWINFSVADKGNQVFLFCFADKSLFGKTVSGLSQHTSVEVKGKIIKLESEYPQQAPSYGLICDYIRLPKP